MASSRQDFLEKRIQQTGISSENLPPDIPGVLEAITEGGGIPAYTEAVAEWAPDTNWAHYSTMFDGGQGGQTGFYNVMLIEATIVLAWPAWWNARLRSLAQNCSSLRQRTPTLAVPRQLPLLLRHRLAPHDVW